MPSNGFWNVCGADLRAVRPGLEVLEREAAVVRGRRRAHLLAATVEQLDRDARQAELLGLDLADRAATRLEVPPDDSRDPALLRLGLYRLRRTGRHVLGRYAGQRSSAVPPVGTGLRSVYPSVSEPVSAGVAGNAVGSAPGGFT